MDNFLLACYKGFYARLWFDEASHKWVGRVLDMEDLLVFDGTDLEDALATFHGGIEEYIKAAGGNIKHGKTQVINMIRYGIEDRPFMDEAREFLKEEGEF